jgi:hypothetical protein
MKTTGYKKLHVSVLLFIIANNNKSLPYTILSRKKMPKEKTSTPPPKKVRMISELMEDLLDMCRNIGFVHNPSKRMLAMYVFCDHQKSEII